MNYSQAKYYADKSVELLRPYCERIEIAGSIRRGRSFCNDVDLVCIPKIEIERDIFQTEIGRKNLAWDFLSAFVADAKNRTAFKSGGNEPGKSMSLQGRACQLDIWFADEWTWGTTLLCRTGSKEHNIWLIEWAKKHRMEWKPSRGLVCEGKTIAGRTEGDIYNLLRLPFIEPKDREGDWLKKNFPVTTAADVAAAEKETVGEWVDRIADAAGLTCDDWKTEEKKP